MLDAVAARGILYQTVLMDSWYATTQVMTRLYKAGKIFYCPLKKNRLVDDSGGEQHYKAVETLSWAIAEEVTGKTVKLNKLSAAIKVKLFRVALSTERTEYIVTNDLTQADIEATQQESGHRWKVEQFHREEKQLTGLGDCECRLNRSQRNYLCASMLVWVCLKQLVYQTGQAIYQLKHGLLSNYLRQQLRNPTIAYC